MILWWWLCNQQQNSVAYRWKITKYQWVIPGIKNWRCLRNCPAHSEPADGNIITMTHVATHRFALVIFPVARSKRKEKINPLLSPVHSILPVVSNARVRTLPRTLLVPPWNRPRESERTRGIGGQCLSSIILFYSFRFRIILQKNLTYLLLTGLIIKLFLTRSGKNLSKKGCLALHTLS